MKDSSAYLISVILSKDGDRVNMTLKDTSDKKYIFVFLRAILSER